MANAILPELPPAADLIPLAVVASRLGLGTATVRDWVVIGVRGANGERVRLKAAKFGSTWKTGERWLREFLAAINPAGVVTSFGDRYPAVAKLRRLTAGPDPTDESTLNEWVKAAVNAVPEIEQLIHEARRERERLRRNASAVNTAAD